MPGLPVCIGMSVGTCVYRDVCRYLCNWFNSDIVIGERCGNLFFACRLMARVSM